MQVGHPIVACHRVALSCGRLSPCLPVVCRPVAPSPVACRRVAVSCGRLSPCRPVACRPSPCCLSPCLPVVCRLVTRSHVPAVWSSVTVSPCRPVTMSCVTLSPAVVCLLSPYRPVVCSRFPCQRGRTLSTCSSARPPGSAGH